jgi:hypothetical protein
LAITGLIQLGLPLYLLSEEDRIVAISELRVERCWSVARAGEVGDAQNAVAPHHLFLGGGPRAFFRLGAWDMVVPQPPGRQRQAVDRGFTAAGSAALDLKVASRYGLRQHAPRRAQVEMGRVGHRGRWACMIDPHVRIALTPQEQDAPWDEAWGGSPT